MLYTPKRMLEREVPDSKHMQKHRTHTNRGAKMIRMVFNDFVKLFETPSALKLAQAELDSAKRELLKAQTAVEYARNIAVYNEQRIARLEQFVKAEHA
jgi:hypothetical protein